MPKKRTSVELIGDIYEKLGTLDGKVSVEFRNMHQRLEGIDKRLKKQNGNITTLNKQRESLVLNCSQTTTEFEARIKSIENSKLTTKKLTGLAMLFGAAAGAVSQLIIMIKSVI